MWHDMWNDGIMMHNWGFGMWFFFLVAIALIAVVLVVLTRSQSTAPAGNADGSALDVLERRFAAGEIDEDEFERRKRKLQE